MRVCFLLNHHAPHQVPHVAPHAFALSRARPDWDITVACSSKAEADFAQEIGTLYPGHHCRIERLPVPLWASAIDPIAKHFAFLRKRVVQSANLDRFAGFDAIVVPEMTSLNMRNHDCMAGVKFIFTTHGAGDGYNQFGNFNARIDTFDLVLLPGPHIAGALQDNGYLAETPYGLVGYSKFEIEALAAQRSRLFDNDRPTVLYNPTQNPAGCSWHRYGTDVLDFFYQSDDYNLIFAPHVLLFARAFTRGARLPRRYRSTENVLIDLGSRASIDMTYLNAVDIYLGDMSSQIYEFIARPRPAVFLDPFDADQPRNFRSWTFGPVIDQVDQLGPALARTRNEFDQYRPKQEAALAEHYAASDLPPSTRGAEVIAHFLETGAVDSAYRLAG
jgi:hypothetical protein